MRTAKLMAAMTLLCLALPASGSEEEGPGGWKDSAELSFVATAGNSESSTLGFSNKLHRSWDDSRFELNAKMVRAESRTEKRFATGTASSFRVVEPDPELSANNYSLDGRYDRKISGKFFWFGTAGWQRDRFAGIDNRYTAGGGVGSLWVQTDRTKFRTDYALTYTREDLVAEDTDLDESFLGLRASVDFMHKFNPSTTYDHDTIIDENLKTTQDFRVDMTNAVSVAINSKVALKVSAQLIYDNEPAFEELELFQSGISTGTTVLAELDELDTIFRTSLVIDFG